MSKSRAPGPEDPHGTKTSIQSTDKKVPIQANNSNPAALYEEAHLQKKRSQMVSQQITKRGVHNPRVLKAMDLVERHHFLSKSQRDLAYGDHPVPIGYHQTISQPYIVAAMAELAELTPKAKVLEIGTGCGYQTAVLSKIAEEVYSIEIIKDLGEAASQRLTSLGFDNIHLRIGDGYEGWPEAAPFDAIIVSAAAPVVPPPLRQQLRIDGHLVIPVGQFQQNLRVITRTQNGYDKKTIFAVRFVPMTGKAQA